MYRSVVIFLSLLCLVCVTHQPICAEQEVATRPIYVISDLHMNFGYVAAQTWSRIEDFRWSKALDGFLKRVAKESPQGVDLVIAGDFLELWQHPSLECVRPKDVECGCSAAEMSQLVTEVVRAHQDVLKSFGEFLSNPSNQVYVTPGNHDAALMVPEIWNIVSNALPEGKERFHLVKSGTWLSPDGQVAIEHGHQQTYDVNAFPDWPKVTKNCGEVERFYRPWGENFVQSLYNEVEEQFLLIDNLVAESTGVKIYWDSRGREGKRLADVARFLVFNLFQTSFQQKLGALEAKQAVTALDEKQLSFCKDCVKEDLVTYSLPPGDSVRIFLEQARDNPNMNKEGSELRLTLRNYVEHLELKDPKLRVLCEKAIIMSGSLKATPDMAEESRCSGTLGTVLNRIFDPEGSAVLENRLSTIKKKYPGLTVYVFGHTHDAREQMSVKTDDGLRVKAFNSGAFQRLMDERYFKEKALKFKDPIEALQQMTHDDLAPCYSIVEVVYRKGIPFAELKHWFMYENDGSGRFLKACDSLCSAKPGSCAKE